MRIFCERSTRTSQRSVAAIGSAALVLSSLAPIGMSSAAASTVEQTTVSLAKKKPNKLLVVNRSMGGIKWDATKAQVRRAVGKPRKKESDHGLSSWEYRHISVSFSSLSLSGERKKATVINLNTKSKKIRTKKGIGVGSTMRQVKRRVRGEDCFGVPPAEVCLVSARKSGHGSTRFEIRKGKVYMINISRT